MKIAWADAHVVVVDKPFGLASHPGPTVTDDVVTRLKRTYPYVGLHHRLDLPTSGLLLFAIDPAANPSLASAFSGRRVQRTYKAVLVGRATGGVWDRPIDGQTAVTHVKVHGQQNGLSAVHLKLETGRTHQIRIHAALAGTPVAGDRRHGGDAGRRWPRLALHAARLRFPHPITGEEVAVESEIPDDLVPLWHQALGN